MCDFSPLLLFDVYSTGASDFFVNKTCLQISNPFNQYCLIAPASRLDGTTTCSQTLQNGLALFVFQDAISGRINLLRDLPIVFESFPDVKDSTSVWIDHVNDVPNKVLPGFGRYNGFKPLPNRRAVSIDNNTNTLLMFMTLDASLTFNLMRIDDVGLLRPQRDVVTEEFLVGSVSDTSLQTFVSGDNSSRLAIINRILYQSIETDKLHFAKIAILAFLNIDDVLINRSNLIVARVGAILYFVEMPSQTVHIVQFGSELVFVVPTQNTNHLLMCVQLDQTPNSDFYVLVIDVLTRQVVKQWLIDNFTLANLPSPSTPIPLDVLCDGNWVNTSSFLTIYMVPQPDDPCWIVVLSGLAPIASFNYNAGNARITRFIDNTAWTQVTIDAERLYVLSGTVAFPVLGTGGPTLWATENHVRVWGLFGTALWSVNTTVLPLAWTPAANPLHSAMQYNMNDEYDLAPSFPDPELWWLGTKVVEQVPPAVLLVPDFVLATSQHNRFRAVVTGIAPGSATTFPFVLTKLQRINNYHLLVDGNTNLSLPYFFENANLLVPMSSMQHKLQHCVLNSPVQN